MLYFTFTQSINIYLGSFAPKNNPYYYSLRKQNNSVYYLKIQNRKSIEFTSRTLMINSSKAIHRLNTLCVTTRKKRLNISIDRKKNINNDNEYNVVNSLNEKILKNYDY